MPWVRKPNTFIDPSGVKATYQWTINHSEEEAVPRSRQMGSGAPSSDIGLIPQQGVSYPLVFQWKGHLFTQDDKDTMDSWYGLCHDQSIYLKDFDGNQYEVLITDWAPQRIACAWNRRGQIPWYWDYTITIRVLTVMSGDWSHL